MKIRVAVEPVPGGWLTLRITTPDGEYAECCSYTPWNWVADLAEVIHQAGQASYPGTRIVKAAINAPVIHMLFAWTGLPDRQISLEIRSAADSKSHAHQGVLEFPVHCSRAQLLVPLWRALREFETRPLSAELAASRSKFPANLGELEPVIQLLKTELQAPQSRSAAPT